MLQEECEALCPRIGIMAGGKLKCIGSAQVRPSLVQIFLGNWSNSDKYLILYVAPENKIWSGISDGVKS